MSFFKNIDKYDKHLRLLKEKITTQNIPPCVICAEHVQRLIDRRNCLKNLGQDCVALGVQLDKWSQRETKPEDIKIRYANNGEDGVFLDDNDDAGAGSGQRIKGGEKEGRNCKSTGDYEPKFKTLYFNVMIQRLKHKYTGIQVILNSTAMQAFFAAMSVKLLDKGTVANLRKKEFDLEKIERFFSCANITKNCGENEKKCHELECLDGRVKVIQDAHMVIDEVEQRLCEFESTCDFLERHRLSLGIKKLAKTENSYRKKLKGFLQHAIDQKSVTLRLSDPVQELILTQSGEEARAHFAQCCAEYLVTLDQMKASVERMAFEQQEFGSMRTDATFST